MVTSGMSARKVAPELYKGLDAFGVQDRHIFGGRDKDARAVGELWRTQRVTVLYGASGIGKTSLIQAGVMPSLSAGGLDVLPLGRVSCRSSHPRAALPADDPYTLALLASWSPLEAPTRLARMTVPAFLRGRPARRDAFGAVMRTMLAIDHVEELFLPSRRPQADRDCFFEQLAEVLSTEDGPHLLLSVRADWLTDLLPYVRKLSAPHGEHFRLEALNFDEALEAVTQPVERAGRAFAEGAADRLVNDLIKVRARSDRRRQPEGVEPVQLQVVCRALWNALPAKPGTTDVIQYADAAADEILAEHYRGALSDLAAERFNDDDFGLRTWLRLTFAGRPGRRSTGRRELIRRLGSGRTMAALVKDRLVRADERMGERVYEPAYDRLLEPSRMNGRPTALTRRRPAKGSLRMAEDALCHGELILAARHGAQALAAPESDDFARAKAQSLLGDVAHEHGCPEEAISHYTRAAQGFDAAGAVAAVSPLLIAIGRLRLALGQPSEAVRELRAAMARVPTDLPIQTDLAWALWHGGHPEAAVGVLDGVLSKEGNNTEALLGRGQILAGLGRAHDALRDLDRAKPLRSPSAKIAHALALAQTGSMDRAQSELAAAMADAGGHGPVLLYAARVEELSGRMRSAAELAGRAISAAAPALPRHLEPDAQRLAGNL